MPKDSLAEQDAGFTEQEFCVMPHYRANPPQRRFMSSESASFENETRLTKPLDLLTFNFFASNCAVPVNTMNLFLPFIGN